MTPDKFCPQNLIQNCSGLKNKSYVQPLGYVVPAQICLDSKALYIGMLFGQTVLNRNNVQDVFLSFITLERACNIGLLIWALCTVNLILKWITVLKTLFIVFNYFKVQQFFFICILFDSPVDYPDFYIHLYSLVFDTKPLQWSYKSHIPYSTIRPSIWK